MEASVVNRHLPPPPLKPKPQVHKPGVAVTLGRSTTSQDASRRSAGGGKPARPPPPNNHARPTQPVRRAQSFASQSSHSVSPCHSSLSFAAGVGGGMMEDEEEAPLPPPRRARHRSETTGRGEQQFSASPIRSATLSSRPVQHQGNPSHGQPLPARNSSSHFQRHSSLIEPDDVPPDLPPRGTTLKKHNPSGPSATGASGRKTLPPVQQPTTRVHTYRDDLPSSTASLPRTATRKHGPGNTATMPKSCTRSIGGTGPPHLSATSQQPLLGTHGIVRHISFENTGQMDSLEIGAHDEDPSADFYEPVSPRDPYELEDAEEGVGGDYEPMNQFEEDDHEKDPNYYTAMDSPATSTVVRKPFLGRATPILGLPTPILGKPASGQVSSSRPKPIPSRQGKPSASVTSPRTKPGLVQKGPSATPGIRQQQHNPVPGWPAPVPGGDASPRDPVPTPRQPGHTPRDPAHIPRDPAHIPRDPAHVPRDPAPRKPVPVPRQQSTHAPEPSALPTRPLSSSFSPPPLPPRNPTHIHSKGGRHHNPLSSPPPSSQPGLPPPSPSLSGREEFKLEGNDETGDEYEDTADDRDEIFEEYVVPRTNVPTRCMTSPSRVTNAVPTRRTTSPSRVTNAVPTRRVTSPSRVTNAVPTRRVTSPSRVTNAVPTRRVTSPSRVTNAVPTRRVTSPSRVTNAVPIRSTSSPLTVTPNVPVRRTPSPSKSLPQDIGTYELVNTGRPTPPQRRDSKLMNGNTCTYFASALSQSPSQSSPAGSYVMLQRAT